MCKTPVKDFRFDEMKKISVLTKWNEHISAGGHPQPPNPVLPTSLNTGESFSFFQIYTENSKYLKTKDFVCSFSSLSPKNSREPVLPDSGCRERPEKCVWGAWPGIGWPPVMGADWEKKLPLSLGWGTLLGKEMGRVKLELPAEGWKDLLSSFHLPFSLPSCVCAQSLCVLIFPSTPRCTRFDSEAARVLPALCMGLCLTPELLKASHLLLSDLIWTKMPQIASFAGAGCQMALNHKPICQFTSDS